VAPAEDLLRCSSKGEKGSGLKWDEDNCHLVQKKVSLRIQQFLNIIYSVAHLEAVLAALREWDQ
jgi:hypothetical protein